MKQVSVIVTVANDVGYNIYITIRGNGHTSSISFDEDTPVIPGFYVSPGDYSIAIHVVTGGRVTITFNGISNILPPLPTFSSIISSYLGDGTI